MKFAPRILFISEIATDFVVATASESIIVWGININHSDTDNVNVQVKQANGTVIFSIAVGAGAITTPRRVNFDIPFLADKGLTISTAANLVSATVYCSQVGA